MTSEEIRRIVDDESAEQLTAQLCRHWEVATERLSALVQDLEQDMDICIDAEVYAAVMRMQSCVMVLMELNKKPCSFLFSEYLDRIAKSVSNTSIRKSAMALAKQLFTDQPEKGRQHDSFFELVIHTMTQHAALSPEKQYAIEQKISSVNHVFALCSQYLDPEDIMMVASMIREIKTNDSTDDKDETLGYVVEMRQAMDALSGKMVESRQHLLICLLLSIAYVYITPKIIEALNRAVKL